MFWAVELAVQFLQRSQQKAAADNQSQTISLNIPTKGFFTKFGRPVSGVLYRQLVYHGSRPRDSEHVSEIDDRII